MPLIAGLFGHRHPAAADPAVVAWYHQASAWAMAHWAVLAVVIPVAGGIAAGVINHYLALLRENRTRKLTLRETRARVHADLAARLLGHCARVAHEASNGSVDAAAWRASNAALHDRAQRSDVVDALGKSYVAFMAAIEWERRAIGHEAPHRSLEAYVPFIADFGEGAQARRLQRTLRSNARGRSGR